MDPYKKIIDDYLDYLVKEEEAYSLRGKQQDAVFESAKSLVQAFAINKEDVPTVVSAYIIEAARYLGSCKGHWAAIHEARCTLELKLKPREESDAVLQPEFPEDFVPVLAYLERTTNNYSKYYVMTYFSGTGKWTFQLSGNELSDAYRVTKWKYVTDCL